jgi:hypothetical protein
MISTMPIGSVTLVIGRDQHEYIGVGDRVRVVDPPTPCGYCDGHVGIECGNAGYVVGIEDDAPDVADRTHPYWVRFDHELACCESRLVPFAGDELTVIGSSS